MVLWLSGQDGLSVACAPASKDLRVAFTSDRHRFGRTGLLTAAWPVTFRFDSDTPITKDWYHDNDIAQSFGSGDITPFIKGTLTADKVTIRAREYFGRGDQFDTTFQLNDARDEVSEVVRACGDTKVARAFKDLLAPAN